MARTKGQLKYFTFGGGWHTASTEVAFPPNAVSNIVNMDIRHDGSVSRRAGIDALGAANNFSATSATEVNTYVWENVGNTPNLIYTVVQVGAYVVFYDYSSVEPLVGSVDLSGYATTSVDIADYPMQFASGSGRLFVANPYMEPIYIDSALSVTQITINTRDFPGVDDSLDVDARPAALSDEHKYNLLNSGWPTDRINTFYSSQGVYPSNADVHFLGTVANPTTGVLQFNADQVVAQSFGNTPAPTGHYIFNEFFKNRGIVDESIDIPTVSTVARPGAVAFYNGRVFWGGVPSGGNVENWGSRIYFSQQLTTLSRVNNYYQEQDPTSEDFNDLLDTDGGVLTIPEMGRAVALHPTALGILIFADNGVWEIRGDADGAFTPTGYSVRKITNIGAVGPSSIVEVAGVYMYWADDGIIALQEDRVSLGIRAVNITESTIDSKYKEISAYGKARCVGTYNGKDNTVMWVYNDIYHYDYTKFRGTYHDDGDFNYKNRALILDVSLQCFYRYAFEMEDTAEHVVAVASARTLTSATEDETVTSQGVDVTANSVTVTSPVDARTATTNAGVRLVLRNGTDIRVGAFSNEDFQDLSSATHAVIECAYITGQSASFKKTGNYVTTYAKEQRFTFAYSAPAAAQPIIDLADFEEADGGPEDVSGGIGDTDNPVTDGGGNPITVQSGSYTLPEDCLDCGPDPTWEYGIYWEAYLWPGDYATVNIARQAALVHVAQVYAGADIVTTDVMQYVTGSRFRLINYNINDGQILGSYDVVRKTCQPGIQEYCPLEAPTLCGDDWDSDGVIEYLYANNSFTPSECDPDAVDLTPKTYIEVSDGDNKGALIANTWDGYMYVPLSTTTGNPIDGSQVSYYNANGERIGTRQYNRTRVVADAYDPSQLNWE